MRCFLDSIFLRATWFVPSLRTLASLTASNSIYWTIIFWRVLLSLEMNSIHIPHRWLSCPDSLVASHTSSYQCTSFGLPHTSAIWVMEMLCHFYMRFFSSKHSSRQWAWFSPYAINSCLLNFFCLRPMEGKQKQTKISDFNSQKDIRGTVVINIKE